MKINKTHFNYENMSMNQSLVNGFLQSNNGAFAIKLILLMLKCINYVHLMYCFSKNVHGLSNQFLDGNQNVQYAM